MKDISPTKPTKPTHLAFITGNPAKVALAEQRLVPYGISLIQQALDLEENQSMEVEDVALYKAKQALKRAASPFIIEDSAFYIPALHGFPGTLIKPVFDALGAQKVLRLLDGETDRTAEMRSVLVYGNPATGERRAFFGVYAGTIAPDLRGDHARGWKVERLFIPDGWTKTVAELDEAEWRQFLGAFTAHDHYEAFGRWFSQQGAKAT